MLIYTVYIWAYFKIIYKSCVSSIMTLEATNLCPILGICMKEFPSYHPDGFLGRLNFSVLSTTARAMGVSQNTIIFLRMDILICSFIKVSFSRGLPSKMLYTFLAMLSQLHAKFFACS
jgi:hypothetical protein